MDSITLWKNWCYKAHADVNHLYEGLPYSFHLKMAEQAAEPFLELIPDRRLRNAIVTGLPGHDLIEDAHKSYSDIFHFISSDLSAGVVNAKMVAEIIYACTDNRGRNRDERHSGDYWPVMQATPGAPFVKMADRIANVKFGLLTDSSMVQKYKKEQAVLEEKIGSLVPKEMLAYLNKLLATVL